MHFIFEIEVNVYSSGNHHQKKLLLSPRNFQVTAGRQLGDYQAYLSQINNINLDGLDLVIQERKILMSNGGRFDVLFICKPFKYMNEDPKEVFSRFRNNKSYWKCLEYKIDHY